MSARDQLLNLFAKSTVAELEADDRALVRAAFGKRTNDDLAIVPGYTDHFDLIKRCKRAVEDVIASNNEVAFRINGFISFIRNRRRENSNSEAEVFEQLVRRAPFFANWTQAERDRFDLKFNFALTWPHYFLSYTNRNAHQTNGDFESLINYVLPPAQRPDPDSKNLVARVVARQLTQHNARGAYDWEKIKSGDDVGDAVRDWCRKSGTLVQIIEQACFVVPEGGNRNWCLEEYQEFSASRLVEDLAGQPQAKRFHFVITVEDIADVRPADMPEFYDPWYEHAQRSHRKTLRTNDRDGFKRDIRDVADQILTMWREAVQASLERP